MTDSQFEKFRKLIQDELGNSLSEEKKTTVSIKVEKIMKKYHPEIKSIDDYYNMLVKSDKKTKMWERFVDNITVHKTDFFRERAHFDYLSENIEKIMTDIPRIKENREIRVWCAAASTGEEPYTIAMTLKEIMPTGYKIKFLATDISEQVLEKAIAGIYPSEAFDQVPASLRDKYFDHLSDGKYQAKDSLKAVITFRKLNLMDPFIFKNKFDIIFCRNVMIYFDEPTKANIVKKIYDVTANNGIFILGLSESLGLKTENFTLIKSSMYYKKI